MQLSIIIPTMNHCEDLLKPCLKSVVSTIDLNSTEVIVVANGCTDGTQEYVKSLGLKLVDFEKPLGYTRAVNEGLKHSTGEYIILLNNDTVVLNNTWISMLKSPFEQDSATGITGPVKFTWDCGGINRTAIAFWCCMFKRSLVNEIGYLDELFSPGMGEDGDFSIKAELIGYKLIQVPVNAAKVFGEGLSDTSFPIWHKGNGTFADMVTLKDERVAINNKILEDRYSNRLEKIYDIAFHHECDVNQLFPVLRKYASRCEKVTEFGVRGVMTTYAFLASRPKKMISFDIYTSPNINEAIEVAQESGINFKFIEQNVLTADIEETDLLFIDTLHTYQQLSQELSRHGNKARKYILIHDTSTWGIKDEVETPTEKKGEIQAIADFLIQNSCWRIVETIEESNGLIVLERIPKFSIIIPSCTDDTLCTCIDKVLRYTNLFDKEVIVAANGCSSGTLSYLSSLRRTLSTITWPDKQGQITPVNAGADIARGDYLIFLDDDSHLLEQPVDTWINRLYQPFKENPKAGMSGVFVTQYPYIGMAIHNGCTMYKREAWAKVGGMDLAFQFGYLCDTDISLRIRKEGYDLVDVGSDGTFPIYHPGSPVTSEIKKKDVQLIRENRNLLYERHDKKPMISIIIPTYNHLEDCLKPCCDSLKEHTNLEDIEVLVVANGCKDGTADYVDSLGHPFKLVWFDEGLGYTKATNEGIKRAKGEYVVLLNNDTVFLDKGYPKNAWIEMLLAPFKNDEKVGITGPLQLHDRYAAIDTMIFFCVAMPKSMFDKIGLLDEIFSPGGGEDIAWCAELQKAGYKQVVVPDNNTGFTFTNTGGFPVYHAGEGTFTNAEFPEYGKRIIKENGMKNMLRYNKHIKLNLGSGGVEIPGYISIDKYDHRAHIVMDIENLDLPENSVEEILNSHNFEHLNPYHATENLRKWFRILKPSGKLIMEMPDLEQLCKRFVTADKWGRYGITNAFYGSVNTTGVGGPDCITSPHLFGYWPESIKEHLEWAGFVNITFGPELFPHPESNMHVEAVKP